MFLYFFYFFVREPLLLSPIELIPTNDNGSRAAFTYGGTSFLTNEPPETIACFPTPTN